MHLKSLTLKGFKSFADRSHLVFEPGVTVVVGPNGSGKSNVADAVLWVLGEQSAKQLRGQSMEDVIFAGSSARQPVGVAEVDLVLDNSDHIVPIEFDEITITRRMFRSGESEYYLNHAPCRLMDIHDLLSDTGLGRDTHSIISQGRLDEVLSSRPEDRRTLIEEAAGIAKHKKRKERALSKLSTMDGHVERIKDVIAELDRQLRPLARAADRARRHGDLVRELREIEVALAVDDVRELRQRWDSVSTGETAHTEDVELARYRLAEKERELSKFQSLLEEKGLFAGDLSEQRRRLQAILERLNASMLLLEEKGKNLVDRLSDLRATVHHNESRITLRRAEAERITNDRSTSDGKLQELYTRLGELRREAEGVRKSRLAAEEAVTAVQSSIRRERKVADDTRHEASKLNQALGALRLEVEFVQGRSTDLEGRRAEALDTLTARRGRLEKLDATIARDRKRLALAESDVDRRVRHVESHRRALDEARETVSGVRAEIRAIEEVDRAFESASPALAWIMANESVLPDVLGPASDAITVHADYERLVELALGSDLFCVLAKDRASAAHLLSQLAAEAPGDISVMPLDGARCLSDAPGVGVRLIEAVRCDDAIRPAVEALIGDIYVVDSLEAALDAAAFDTTGSRFATREGHLVWPNGKVGFGPAAESSSGVLTRKRRINVLRDTEANALSRLGQTENELGAAEEALSAAQLDALELSQGLANARGESDSLREEIGRLETQFTQLEREGQLLIARTAEISERIARDEPTHAALVARVAAAEEHFTTIEDDLVARREERDTCFRTEAGVSGRLSECQVDIATVSEREVNLKRQIASIDADVKELTAALARARETEMALELLRERIQPLHDLYSVLLARSEHWAEKLRDRARFEAADSDSLRQTIHAAQEAVRSAQGELDAIVETGSQLRVDRAQLEIQVDTAVRRIVEEFGVPLERALELPRVEDRTVAEKTAGRLRSKVNDLGPVNPVAVHEHAALQQRRDFLSAQLADLDAAKNALGRIVRAIDRKMRDRFLDTFEKVDQHFQQVFTVLFPGGSAQLRMTDPDNPSETGIEVVAQPSGKKLSKMTLMSGGEKSLTALALLFALYHTRPTPFYILDEVEAALDDTNLRRFVTFVDSLRQMTQFLIVSHQRRTMESADVLYGVSMQADGVSKVVSQRLGREDGGQQATGETTP